MPDSLCMTVNLFSDILSSIKTQTLSFLGRFVWISPFSWSRSLLGQTLVGPATVSTLL